MGHLRELTVSCPLAFGDNTSRRCSWCGRPLPSGRRRWCGETCNQAFLSNHYWKWARAAALKRDGNKCVRCGAGGDVFVPMEVNHKTPVMGRHAERGCHHHMSDLETLCHRCHVDETNQQRAAGLFRSEGAAKARQRRGNTA